MQSLKHSLIWLFLFILLGLPFSFVAFGSDLRSQQNTLYPYRSSIFLQDDFLSGTTSGGNVGELGFTISGGTATIQASAANRLGVIRRDTSAVINTATTMPLYASSSAIDPSLSHSVFWIARVNTNDANTQLKIGSQNSAFSLAPGEGIYFEKLDPDTNWFCVTRAGGVQTRTDSTVAVSTNFDTFFYQRNSSGVTFKINNADVCGTHTTNIPTAFINPSVSIQNSAAAAKTVDIDYFEFILTGLTR